MTRVVALILRRSVGAGRIFRRIDPDGERYWFVIASQVALVSVLIYGVQVDVFHFPLKAWWLVAALGWVMYELAREQRAAEETA